MMLKTLLCASAFAVCASLALAQSGGPYSAPASRVFQGPTIGEMWLPASSTIAGINVQTGTTYTIAAPSATNPAGDQGKLVVINNGSAIAVTLPQAGTNGFAANQCFNILDIGAGTATVTPTTSTINGAVNKTYAQNAAGRICSDGTNYYAF
jgi:hypothetical protein